MIDLETGIVAAGVLALALSFLMRFHSNKLTADLEAPLLPGRHFLKVVLLLIGLSALIILAIPDQLSGVFFLTGGLSSLSAAAFFIRPSAFFQGTPGEKYSMGETANRLSAGACGLFAGGLAAAAQGGLQMFESWLNSGPDVEGISGRWLFAGLGAATAVLIGSFFPGSGTRYRHVFRSKLSILFLACFLAVCIPAAMEFLVYSEIPDWMLIPQMVALAGVGLLLIGTGIGLATAGKGREAWLFVSALLIGAAAYFTVRKVMTGLPSQSLISTGMMDRMGPFWAIGIGLATALLTRSLFLYDRSAQRDRRVPVKTLFFLAMNIWISYAAAGLSGIALSGLGAAVLLPLMISLDMGETGSEAVGEYTLTVSLLAAVSTGAYILFYLFST